MTLRCIARAVLSILALGARRLQAGVAGPIAQPFAKSDHAHVREKALLERGFLRLRVRIPYEKAALVDLFHRRGSVASERHTDTGTLITGSLPARFAAPFQRYAVR